MIELHTSDRVLWKRCRRKWSWQSPMMANLTPLDGAPNWKMHLGTGVHFALEDYYGYRRFLRPEEALQAFFGAHKRDELPDEHVEALALGKEMLSYYVDYWLPRREEYKTLYVAGVPQVEVRVHIPLATDPPTVYSCTFDRVVEDSDQRIWVVDYKTVDKEFDTARLELDPQWGAYNWAGRLLYGSDRVEGGIWHQFKRAVPDRPQELKRGGFSLDKRQHTNWAYYREALVEKYGEVPQHYMGFLNDLAGREDEESDAFIRRQRVRRNAANAEVVEALIFQEADDMLAAKAGSLALYPNPTRDCSYDCNFRAACIAKDDGSDWESMIEEEFVERETVHAETWRKRLDYPAIEVTL